MLKCYQNTNTLLLQWNLKKCSHCDCKIYAMTLRNRKHLLKPMDCESQHWPTDSQGSEFTGQVGGASQWVAGRRGRCGTEYIHQIDHGRLREEINGEPLRSSADHTGVECLSHLWRPRVSLALTLLQSLSSRVVPLTAALLLQETKQAQHQKMKPMLFVSARIN